ncbi:MAG: ABC transporter ATP-binding protein [Mariprofundaceae bacterium]
MSSSTLLKVADLHKAFAGPSGLLHILQGINLELQSGEFLAVVGESGSGKSTLLQVVGTLEPPDRGEAQLDGQALFGLNAAAQSRVRNEMIGFVYQAHHLIPELTALENVMLPLLVKGLPAHSASERGRELLERLHMGKRVQHVPARLSGGEAQRVAVARALAAKPRLLLADEPTGNLDEATAIEVFDTLRQLCREESAAVIMVTHSRPLAQACDRLLCLQGGRLFEKELLKNL